MDKHPIHGETDNTNSWRVHSFGMIQIKVNDQRSVRTGESTLNKDLWVPLMHHDLTDLELLIRIIMHLT